MEVHFIYVHGDERSCNSLVKCSFVSGLTDDIRDKELQTCQIDEKKETLNILFRRLHL